MIRGHVTPLGFTSFLHSNFGFVSDFGPLSNHLHPGGIHENSPAFQFRRWGQGGTPMSPAGTAESVRFSHVRKSQRKNEMTKSEIPRGGFQSFPPFEFPICFEFPISNFAFLSSGVLVTADDTKPGEPIAS